MLWTVLHPPLPSALTPSPSAPAPVAEDTSAAGFWFLLLVFGVIWAIGWRISLRRHPFKACPDCNGTGKHRGTWFSGAFRACDRCGGTAREYRAFARAPYKQNENKRRGRR
ncbi:hypothetical protein ACIBF1_15560 [Spirillospora sp. NPDC050679]